MNLYFLYIPREVVMLSGGTVGVLFGSLVPSQAAVGVSCNVSP